MISGQVVSLGKIGVDGRDLVEGTSAARNALNISNRRVTIFGAYGHTGRFVAAELHKRGWKTILSGRDAAKLNAVAAEHPESEVRVASVDDDLSLDRAIADASAVINCAGPFIDTAVPIIEAALRSGIHYWTWLLNRQLF